MVAVTIVNHGWDSKLHKLGIVGIWGPFRAPMVMWA